MSYQVFVSCSTWPQDVSAVEPFREQVRLAGKIPYTYGIDEEVEKEREFQHIVQRIGESAAVIVVHTHRYQVNGHLASLWLQREPIISAMKGKPVFEFYETGIRPESLLRDISINQVEFNRDEFLNEQGKNRIREWVEHFFWHVDQHLHSWAPWIALVGTAGGGALTRSLWGAASGGILGWVAGSILDSFKPTCKFCSRTYPPRFW